MQMGSPGGGQPYTDLLDPAPVVSVLAELLGDPSWEHCHEFSIEWERVMDAEAGAGGGQFPLPRLDNNNGLWLPPSTTVPDWRAPPERVLLLLLPIDAGCGGTVICAGSHRAYHPRPPEAQTLLPPHAVAGR